MHSSSGIQSFPFRVLIHASLRYHLSPQSQLCFDHASEDVSAHWFVLGVLPSFPSLVYGLA
uniref:Uncharacterized protein n=1 Tax=Arundo donax TaxID=35708 RepID=A0A0A9G7R0_ARUDO